MCRDLGRALGSAAGEDVLPWLAQWLDRPGAPALRVLDVAARPRGGAHVLELTLAQTQGGPPYLVDVPVYVTLADRLDAVLHTLHLGAARQRFTIDLPAEPARVDVGPEYDLFRRLDRTELPPTLGGAFGAAEAVVARAAGAAERLRRARRGLAQGRHGGRERRRPAALPPGKAVWILGWENRLRDALAGAVRAYGGGLTADALRSGALVLARSGNAVAVAVRSPSDAGQVAAFVAAADPRALPGLGRKLPHDGKYSLLGFEGDAPSNTAKETWPVPTSPLTAVLRAGNPPVARGKLAERAPLATPPASAQRGP